ALLMAVIPVLYIVQPYYPIASWALIGILFLGAISALYPATTIVLGSCIFKFRERDWLLDMLSIQGNERILDVGCGRGLLLIGAAKRLNSIHGGKAIGIDICSA